MNIRYVLMGINQEDEIEFEHDMTAEEVIPILASALANRTPSVPAGEEKEVEEQRKLLPTKRKCGICGTTGHSKKTCPKVASSGGVPASRIQETFSVGKKSRTKITDEQRADIMRLRNDGYSGLQIETELGLNKAAIYKVLNEEGISGKPKKSDDMRCAKCKQKGHHASQCPTGDALDQLDKDSGYVDSAPATLSSMDFIRIKLSQDNDIPADVVARNLSLDIAIVERAFEFETHSDFLKANP